MRIRNISIYRNISLIAIALLLPRLIFAHGGTDEPLFVAADGLDRGDCKDRNEPCQSIGYALKRAGKGGQIRVAAGTYAIENAEDLFHLVSGSVEAFGGFQRENDFRPALDHVSTLTNVPHEFRDQLERRGFHVIADGKGVEREKFARTEKFLALNERLQASMTAAPCANGSVNGLACDSVDLLSHMAFADLSATPRRAADVWGFVDLNTNREYAIIGYDNGTAVVDVTNAETPAEVAYFRGQTTTWRDIKVYQYFDQVDSRWKAYAYVTADGASDGLHVLDLTGLPNSVRRLAYTSDFRSAHNVYATNTDYSTGISLTGDTPSLMIAGSDIGRGNYRAYSLADPTAPQFVGSASNAGYMHDASSMIVTDSRKDTQCVNAGAYCEVLLDFNEREIEIWDVTDIGNPALLSTTAYANATYVHSGWWSEDKQYLYVHDELDELQRGLQTTLRVFSVADLTNPVEVGAWLGSTSAIDHNGFVRGSRYYMSNYSRGLTILDLSNPAAPTAVGNLDTYPFSNSSAFVGAWGAYPFYYSGNIAVSDISSGFYLAADRSRNVPQGSLSYAQTSYGVAEGDQVALQVNRVDGSTGNIAVDYEILAATADSGDFTSVSGQLSWSAGDISSKPIIIAATNDGVVESLEHLIVRLVAPTGGATLGDDSTSHLYIGDPGEISMVQFMTPSLDVSEQGFGMAIVTAHRVGSALGAVSVDFDLANSNAESGIDFQGSTSGTFSWNDGDAMPKYIEFVVVDDGITETDEFFELTLSNPAGGSIGTNTTIRVNISDSSPVVDPPVAPRGNKGGGGTDGLLISVTLTLLLLRRRRFSRKDVA